MTTETPYAIVRPVAADALLRVQVYPDSNEWILVDARNNWSVVVRNLPSEAAASAAIAVLEGTAHEPNTTHEEVNASRL